MPTITTNDGTQLYYDTFGEGDPLLMIHGWGFSGRFFYKNVETLAQKAKVITVDLRGHGNSDKPSYGYRISRLAKDIYDLILALDLERVTILGWSLGCPVIWNYIELFGHDRLSQAIFVEQPPRQYIGEDWKYAHATCFDEASLASMKAQVTLATDAFNENQIETIMHTALREEERNILIEEMNKTPVAVRNAVMTDHTRHDWRDLIPHIDLPCLVLVAKQDSVFAWQGPAWVGENIPGADIVYFENSGHALFLDEADKFNKTVTTFLAKKSMKI